MEYGTMTVRRTAVGLLLGSLGALGAAVPTPVALAADELFVSNYAANKITVYVRTANGDAAPIRLIESGLNHPHTIAVDLLHQELFVSNNLYDYQPPFPAINVFDLDASFPVSDIPKRTITGAATHMTKPAGIAVDVVNQELYVANDLDSGSTIVVFPLGANGNVPPLRTLGGSLTGIEGPLGLAIDHVHDELLVASYKTSDGGSITVFPRTASGNVLPLRTIQGPSTGFVQPLGVALDLNHDEIVVANSAFQTTSPGALLVFPRTASGDVGPVRQIAGAGTGLCNPVGIALDLVNDEIVAANSHFGTAVCSPTATTYARTAADDTAPLRTVGPGPNSQLASPTSVAVRTRVDCSDTSVANGTPCDDGNACTQTDTCQAGVCTGTNPVTCAAPDPCHDPGVCDTATGVCSNPTKADGTLCSDGSACTQTDTCQAGICTGGNAVVCTALDSCHDAGVCDPATGLCPNPVKADGAPCSDANLCTVGDTCVAGTCVGGPPQSCDDGNVCTLDACDPAAGCTHVFQDADGDGVCDALDCAPNDASAFARPPEASGLLFEGDKVTLTWSSVVPAAGPGTVQQVLRGSLVEFPVGSGASESCLGADTSTGAPPASPSATDPTLPGDDSGFWYLVRGKNACGAGPYGFASDGTPEISSTCP